MADINAEGSSYGAMERFLIWFLIPFVFTAVLLGVLLSIFDYDIKGTVQKALHNIPVIGSIIPAPKEKATVSVVSKAASAEKSLQSKDEEISNLNAKLAEVEAALKKADEITIQKDQALKETQAKNTALEEKLSAKTQSEEEYQAQIQQLANLYAKMTPSKSAPIMENLTLKEMVLVFSMMKPEDRGKIMEKMDPKKAAEASIGLKDVVPVRDREIAALQQRLATNGASNATEKSAQKIDKEELGQTIGNMTPKSAATMLMEMQKANADKVVAILSAMDSTSRAKVMSALSDLSKETAAAITAKLAQ